MARCHEQGLQRDTYEPFTSASAEVNNLFRWSVTSKNSPKFTIHILPANITFDQAMPISSSIETSQRAVTRILAKVKLTADVFTPFKKKVSKILNF